MSQLLWVSSLGTELDSGHTSRGTSVKVSETVVVAWSSGLPSGALAESLWFQD